MTVVIVCGGRDWRPAAGLAERAEHWLVLWLWRLDVSAVVHGDAVGADRWAARVVQRRRPDVLVRPEPAQWGRYGDAAGSIRNAAMLQVARSLGDLAGVLALPGRAGTADMCRRAEAVGLLVKRLI